MAIGNAASAVILRVVGRTISVNSQPRVIAGVMPRGFKIVNYDFDLLVPMSLDPVKEILAGFGYRGIARLRPGVTIPQANADVARLLNVWMDSWTNGPGSDPHWYLQWQITPALQPLKDTVVGSIHTVLWVVMAMIGVVMLIACSNVANLLLVRADIRQHELAVRAALGAGRWRIARELLLESLTLGLLGGAVGVAVAYARSPAVDRDWACGPAAAERNFARRLVDRLHTYSLRALGPAVRRYSGIALSAFAAAPDLAGSDADNQRQPRPAACAQFVGSCAGRHGAGSADWRGAHDPHLPGHAQCRSRLLRSRIPAGHATLHSRDAGAR